MTARDEIARKLATTAYAVGATIPDDVSAEMIRLLESFPLPWVLGALDDCALTLETQRLTIADITSRFRDRRPGPDAAWAAVSALADEAASVVWTDGEMNAAWGVALPLVRAGDLIAARMAFLDAYRPLIAEARRTGEPPRWIVSPGSVASLETAVVEALRLGRIDYGYAVRTLAHVEPDTRQALLGSAAGAAAAPGADAAQRGAGMRRAADHLPMLPTVSDSDAIERARAQYDERVAAGGDRAGFVRRGDGLDWARAIRARIASGEALPAISAKLANEALEYADRVEREAERTAQYAAEIAAREPGADEAEPVFPAVDAQACSVCQIPMTFTSGQWRCYVCEANEAER